MNTATFQQIAKLNAESKELFHKAHYQTVAMIQDGKSYQEADKATASKMARIAEIKKEITQICEAALQA